MTQIRKESGSSYRLKLSKLLLNDFENGIMDQQWNQEVKRILTYHMVLSSKFEPQMAKIKYFKNGHFLIYLKAKFALHNSMVYAKETFSWSLLFGFISKLPWVMKGWFLSMVLIKLKDLFRKFSQYCFLTHWFIKNISLNWI